MTKQSFGHLHKRLLELHRVRVIVRSGSRKCRVTGKRATTWKPTGTLPVFLEVEARQSRSEIQAENTTLRARVAELESELSRYRQAPIGQQSLFASIEKDGFR